MSVNTFVEMSRALRLYVPKLPITLAEHFVRDRYRRILEEHSWSALRREGEFLFQVAKTAGTVTVTNNSTAVVGSGTAFAAADEGRQFKVGSNPVYTIASRSDATNMVLDRVWSGEDASAQDYRIADYYVAAPSDFMRFIVVVDPVAGWRLWHWITQDELLAWDPQRNMTGLPYALIDRRYNTASPPVPMYEAWPYCITQRGLHYFYHARGSDLALAADIPEWPIRSDAIVSGALADLCRWPGTVAEPNPMFNQPDLRRSFEAEYNDKIEVLQRQDESVYMTWLSTSDWGSMPMAPLSASYLQSHAFLC